MRSAVPGLAGKWCRCAARLVSSLGLCALGVLMALVCVPCSCPAAPTPCGSRCFSSVVRVVPPAVAGFLCCCQGAGVVIAATVIAAARGCVTQGQPHCAAAPAHCCGARSRVEGPPGPSLAPAEARAQQLLPQPVLAQGHEKPSGPPAVGQCWAGPRQGRTGVPLLGPAPLPDGGTLFF